MREILRTFRGQRRIEKRKILCYNKQLCRSLPAIEKNPFKTLKSKEKINI